MPKEKLLLINLNEEKTKKISEIIASNTSRKILDYLAEKDDTEQNISQSLGLPISTVHYHLQKLMEVQLVMVEEFHYSKKGREVNHYQLANKYIIIAPKKVSGIKRALSNILPVALVVLGISAAIKLFSQKTMFLGAMEKAAITREIMAEAPSFAEGVVETSTAAAEKAPEAINYTAQRFIENAPPQPDIALWFLIGGLTVIFLYLLVVLIKEGWKK